MADNLLEEYLASDPANLSAEQLLEAAKAFNLPLSTVRNIAKGMSNARKELAKQEKDSGEFTASASGE